MKDSGSNGKYAVHEASCVDWAAFDGRTVVVTGATGLVGKAIVRALAARNASYDAGIRIVAPVRDVGRGTAALGGLGPIELVAWDAATGDEPVVEGGADFVVHCASPTASVTFVERPVEVIDAIVMGTRAMLGLARRHGARMVFVSSMEVYGKGSPDAPLSEDRGGELDAMSPRSSYPEAKQLAECLCAAYASECAVDVCVARLAQCFGAGVPPTDDRVFAQFARSAMQGRDIVLLTAGTKRNMYVSVGDAVAALLLLCQRGERGVAYNVANEATLCSIREMAEMVAKRFGGGGVGVRVQMDGDAARRFRPAGEIRLDTSRVRALGWEPRDGLEDAYAQLIAYWEGL